MYFLSSIFFFPYLGMNLCYSVLCDRQSFQYMYSFQLVKVNFMRIWFQPCCPRNQCLDIHWVVLYGLGLYFSAMWIPWSKPIRHGHMNLYYWDASIGLGFIDILYLSRRTLSRKWSIISHPFHWRPESPPPFHSKTWLYAFTSPCLQVWSFYLFSQKCWAPKAQFIASEKFEP